MTTHGLLADEIHGGEALYACMVIGPRVLRIHHSDQGRVYLVIEHEDGAPITFHDGTRRCLLAYPSHWPGPGRRQPDHFVYANHERLPWNAPVPLHDLEEDPDVKA